MSEAVREIRNAVAIALVCTLPVLCGCAPRREPTQVLPVPRGNEGGRQEVKDIDYWIKKNPAPVYTQAEVDKWGVPQRTPGGGTRTTFGPSGPFYIKD